jgi:hypothetical protein
LSTLIPFDAFLLFLLQLFFLLKPELRSARPASGGEWIPYGDSVPTLPDN